MDTISDCEGGEWPWLSSQSSRAEGAPSGLGGVCERGVGWYCNDHQDSSVRAEGPGSSESGPSASQWVGKDRQLRDGTRDDPRRVREAPEQGCRGLVRRGDREPTRAGTRPLESVFGVRGLPVETVAVVRAAIDRMVQDGTVPADEPWRALEVLAER